MASSFVFFIGDTLIGFSNLDKSDESMGIREGRFIPAVGYDSFEVLFQELSAINV